jgi:hypothetical protein
MFLGIVKATTGSRRNLLVTNHPKQRLFYRPRRQPRHTNTDEDDPTRPKLGSLRLRNLYVRWMRGRSCGPYRWCTSTGFDDSRALRPRSGDVGQRRVDSSVQLHCSSISASPQPLHGSVNSREARLGPIYNIDDDPRWWSPIFPDPYGERLCWSMDLQGRPNLSPQVV